MRYSNEQIERANAQGITGYFRNRGYSCEKEGREIHIRGFGGLKVKEETQEYYIHSEHKGGIGLVDCLMKTFNMDFPTAMREALDGEMPNGERTPYTPKNPVPNGEFSETKKEIKQFIMPEKASDNKRIFSYLNKQRCISPEIIRELVNAGLLYQDVKGNAIFLDVKDGVPCGAEFHGTGSKKYVIGNAEWNKIENREVINTKPYIAEQLSQILENEKEINYVGYVYATEANIAAGKRDIEKISGIIEALENSDIDKDGLDAEVKRKLKSFNGVAFGTGDNFFEFPKCENPQGAYVFESAIDMMSFMQLHPDAQNCTLVSMGGLKPRAVESLLARNLQVVLCVDNDEAGKNFCNKFRGKCAVFTECHHNGVKDFNELLQKKFPKASFIGRIESASNWSTKLQEKVKAEKEKNYAAYRNRPLEA